MALTIWSTIEPCRQAVRASQCQGQKVGVVPTMGALHAGHLSLVDAAREECNFVVATIFVNPTQFNDASDLADYPRVLEEDVDMLERHGCDAVFAPPETEMYGANFQTFVEVGSVAESLEGAHRPGHFRGVSTVVLKLLQIVPADIAYFGQKDYQQTLVVRQLAADLNLATEIRVMPTVREADGLAMSSRNARLTPEERQQALAISESLKLAQDACEQGTIDCAALKKLIANHLAAKGIDQVEYIEIVRAGGVEPLERIDDPAVVLIAAQVGETRLIDNCQIG